MLKPGYYWVELADREVVGHVHVVSACSPTETRRLTLTGSVHEYSVGDDEDPKAVFDEEGVRRGDVAILDLVAAREDAGRLAELEARFAQLKIPVGYDRWVLTVRQDSVRDEFAEHVLRTAREGALKGDERGGLRAAVPDLLAWLTDHVLVSDRYSVSILPEMLDLAEEENVALRKNLAWLAARPGVTPDEREELSRRIKNRASEFDVGEDSAEAEAAELNATRVRVEALCDLAQEAIDVNVAEAGPGQGALPPAYDGDRGRLRHGWANQVDNLLHAIRPFTVTAESGTLAELRSLTK